MRRSCSSNLFWRVHHHDNDFGKTHRAQRIGHRQLFQLLLDPRTPPKGLRYRTREVAALPVDLDRDGIARGARLGAGQQRSSPSRWLISVDFPALGTADDGDADRALRKLSSRR